MPSKEDTDELIGKTIARRYRIISRLGAGGMGTAYRAWDEVNGVPVVIKIPKRVFLEDPKFAERFRREIRLLRGLVHPHIVPIVDDGEHEGLSFLVMRFLPGGSLSNRRLRDESGRVRPNPPGMLHFWLPGVADALDAIHAGGVVHRDVKPANIFFDAKWGAFVGDFGIAKIIAESDVFDRERTLTATGMGIGTPDYMAAEQFSPKAVVDGRADQYALAVIVYEMLAGVRPFTGESANLILEVMTLPAPRLNEKRSGLPTSLVAAVDRGLTKRPEDRFATCREFAAAVLRDVQPLEDEPGVARLLCPKCANLLKLPESAAGRTGKCPKCQTAMKVAADLGAMWLLDEARRQEEAASAGWTALGGSATGGGAGGDEPSVDTLRLMSGTTPIGKAAQQFRRGILPWIDGHGLIIGGVLALAASIPWVLLATSPTAQSSPGDNAEIQLLKSRNEATEKKLAEAIERETALREQLAGSGNEEAALKAKSADSPSNPPDKSVQTPPTQIVNPPQKATSPRFPSDVAVWEKNGHGYKVFKETLSWPQAKQRCEDLGGHLVTIASPEEQQFVLSVISEAGISVDVRQEGLEAWHDKLWAGGTDEDSEGNWRWLDGTPWGYSNWLPHQPDNDGNFLDICPHRGGGWNDGRSQDFFVVGFVCEWPREVALARALTGASRPEASDPPLPSRPETKTPGNVPLVTPAAMFPCGREIPAAPSWHPDVRDLYDPAKRDSALARLVAASPVFGRAEVKKPVHHVVVSPTKRGGAMVLVLCGDRALEPLNPQDPRPVGHLFIFRSDGTRVRYSANVLGAGDLVADICGDDTAQMCQRIPIGGAAPATQIRLYDLSEDMMEGLPQMIASHDGFMRMTFRMRRAGELRVIDVIGEDGRNLGALTRHPDGKWSSDAPSLRVTVGGK